MPVQCPTVPDSSASVAVAALQAAWGSTGTCLDATCTRKLQVGAEAVDVNFKGGSSLDFDGFATRPEGPDEAHVRRRGRNRVGRGSPQIERPLPSPLQWPVGPDARVGQQPRYTRVVGNLVREVGLIQKQSSFWFQVQ